MNTLTRIAADISRISRHAEDDAISHEILADIKAGNSFAVPVLSESDEPGTLVFRVQNRVLWIDALFCAPRLGVDVTKIAAELAQRIATQKGCNEIRFDTRRAGLVKKLAESGWEVTRVSLTKKLP